MLGRIFVLFIFCFKVFADAELDLAKKYFTEEEINESLKWEFDFAYSKGGGPWNSYKTEPIKFYTNKELTGEVFAEIDEKGLKIGSKYICTFLKYSDTYSVLARKYMKSDKNLPYARIFTEEYYSDKNQKFGGKVDWKTASRTTCDAFPVLIAGPPDSISIKLKLRVYDEKIGSLKMKGQDVFFDVSTWLKKYFHTPDTQFILKRDLTELEHRDFIKLIYELRTLFENKSIEDIYNFVYERTDKGRSEIRFYGEEKFEKYYKTQWHKAIFGVNTKEEFLAIKLNKKVREELIKSTIYIMQEISNGDIHMSTNIKKFFLSDFKNSLCFEIENSSIGICRIFIR